MAEHHQKAIAKPKKILLRHNGKIFFSKKTERKVFFILTLAMLLLGLFQKLGLF